MGGEALVTFRAGSERRKGRLYFLVRAPGSLVLEAVTPSDETVATFVMHGGRFISFQAGSEKCVSGVPCARNVATVFPAALDGADVVRLLHGLPPLIEGVAAEPKRLEDPPRHHIQIRGPGGGAQTVELSPDGRDVLRSTIGDAEGTVLELVYEDHGAGPGKLRIPRRTEVRAPRQGRVVKLRILEIAATRPKPEAFSTECPAGLLVEPLPCGPAAVTPR